MSRILRITDGESIQRSFVAVRLKTDCAVIHHENFIVRFIFGNRVHASQVYKLGHRRALGQNIFDPCEIVFPVNIIKTVVVNIFRVGGIDF